MFEITPNRRLALDALSWAEGTWNSEANRPNYGTIFGGQQTQDLSKHPKISKPFQETTGRTNRSDAAGAYQFLGSSGS
jgi:muramidase (phage lysozyme)